MNDLLMGGLVFLGSLGFVAFLALIMPWLSVPVEMYWDWCFRVQRRMAEKRNRTT